jgi:hypothetical protein
MIGLFSTIALGAKRRRESRATSPTCATLTGALGSCFSFTRSFLSSLTAGLHLPVDFEQMTETVAFLLKDLVLLVVSVLLPAAGYNKGISRD